MTEPATSPPLVCAVAYDGLCTFEFGIAVELFGLKRPEFDIWYRFEAVSADPGPLRAVGGVTLEADTDLGRLDAADLIIVPGWRGADAPVPNTLKAALRRAHARGARIASICSGVFVLAASGLLDGRRATTHWRYADRLAALYPEIEVDADVLYVEDNRVFTSAGSAAGLDLGLHIIRKDYGVRVANAVARRLVLSAKRDGGQRQFVPRPEPRRRAGDIAPLIETVRARLDEDWPLDRMAREAGMSKRTVSRRFIDEMGTSPLAWLTGERITHATELIESGAGTLADIAEASGFRSLETFRREFKRQTGTAPSHYRRLFLHGGAGQTRRHV